MTKIISAYLPEDSLAQLETLRTIHRRSASDMIRWLIADAFAQQKNLSQNSAIANFSSQPQPQPPQPPSPSPAARHVPTVEELVADYRADGCMMPTYWRHLTEEERDRVARECPLSESDLEFLEGTLEETR